MKIQFTDQAGIVVVWDVPEDKLQQILNVKGCADLFGIPQSTVATRIARSWPVLIALATQQ